MLGPVDKVWHPYSSSLDEREAAYAQTKTDEQTPETSLQGLGAVSFMLGLISTRQVVLNLDAGRLGDAIAREIKFHGHTVAVCRQAHLGSGE